jgi:hypothetical protein
MPALVFVGVGLHTAALGHSPSFICDCDMTVVLLPHHGETLALLRSFLGRLFAFALQ